MADRHTSIRAPDGDFGLADWGRKTRAEMVAQIRATAEGMMEDAQKIMDTKDEDFIVETYTGMHRKRNVETVV